MKILELKLTEADKLMIELRKAVQENDKLAIKKPMGNQYSLARLVRQALEAQRINAPLGLKLLDPDFKEAIPAL